MMTSIKHIPIVFSLEDVRSTLKRRGSEVEKTEVDATDRTAAQIGGNIRRPRANQVQTSLKSSSRITQETPVKHRRLGAASLTDILGFNPNAKMTPRSREIDRLPRKFRPYYRRLVELRDHVQAGLDMRSKDTLKRSFKEDTGNLSSYSQHMADAGTDNFDRDFALSLVSSEHDALFEIEQAIGRILDGSYGICEITGKPINRERLHAVPFTCFSKEGQVEFEAMDRKKVSRTGVFVDSNVVATAQLTDEDSDD